MTAEPGLEIVVVKGRGLAAVCDRGIKDGRAFVHYMDHGPTHGAGLWTWTDNTRLLSEDEAREALTRERREAAARNVSCSGNGCWCVPFCKPAP